MPAEAPTFDPALRAARQGDLQAFNRLVLAHQDTVYNAAYRLLGDEAAAVEATAAAFASARRELRAYRAGPFKVWVLRWLAEACRPRLGRRPAAPGAAWPGCLAALPPAQGLVLALVDIAGLSYAEAGAALGLSSAQVRGDLAAARRALCGTLRRAL
jgi:DNA-directed RNA polymerase specialized sigma24 family protein